MLLCTSIVGTAPDTLTVARLTLSVVMPASSPFSTPYPMPSMSSPFFVFVITLFFLHRNPSQRLPPLPPAGVHCGSRQGPGLALRRPLPIQPLSVLYSTAPLLHLAGDASPRWLFCSLSRANRRCFGALVCITSVSLRYVILTAAGMHILLNTHFGGH